jgi:hypothetical protein
VLLGSLGVEVFRYEKDSRSIPTLDDTNGVTVLTPGCKISVVGGASLMVQPDGTGIEIGTHMQYRVAK